MALRPEPFGALAYHYDNRKLNFLRSPDLVRVVRRLEHEQNVYEALRAAEVPANRHVSFVRALAQLAGGDFLVPQTAETANTATETVTTA